MAHAWSQMSDPSRYAVITDPGTPLAKLAAERGFARCFENPPDIGGRSRCCPTSGWSPPPSSATTWPSSAPGPSAADLTEAAGLGMAMGKDAQRRSGQGHHRRPRDLRLLRPVGRAAGGRVDAQAWPRMHPRPHHRSPKSVPTATWCRFIRPNPTDIAEQFYRWEVAVAICGHVLGIDPFDEPNVAESKRTPTTPWPPSLYRRWRPPPPTASSPGWARSSAGATTSRSRPTCPSVNSPPDLRRRVHDHLGGAPVTVDYGPRSPLDGQLHKGQPNPVIAVRSSASPGPARHPRQGLRLRHPRSPPRPSATTRVCWPTGAGSSGGGGRSLHHLVTVGA